MPGPQQVAMVAALDDDEHVARQHARYAARRAKLREALERNGFRIDHSEASLYLWATREEDCWKTVSDWPTSGSSWPRGRSMALPGTSTCGWPSPPPTSGSTQPSPAWPDPGWPDPGQFRGSPDQRGNVGDPRRHGSTVARCP